MCKKIPPSLTGFDVVGLSYHGSRIANLPATAATMLQPYIGHRLFHHNLFGLLMTIPNPAELRDFPISVKGGQYVKQKKLPTETVGV
ncbi:MAG: hypothetical protein IKW93_08345 [Bacteroidales bacterium]|nr:hypothetical protein [Bacteroidales bacterium]